MARVSIDLAYPKEIGGSGAGSNPEQLVADGVCQPCFQARSAPLARRRQFTLTGVEVTCNASLHRDDDAFSLSFEITAHVPGLDPEEADSIVAEAHAYCP